jgi:SsrA-binding protein
MSGKKKKKLDFLAQNRKARHDYDIVDTYEAGLVLHGWEVKSIRQGKAQLLESYVRLRGGEAFLFNAHVSPLLTASTHVRPDPTRLRKCLLHHKELKTLIGHVQRDGMTLIPLSLYLKNQKIKLSIALAKGKKKYDKRQAQKEKDWQREKKQLEKFNKRAS